MSKPIIEVHFYGGHADGLTREFEGSLAPTTCKVATRDGHRHPPAGPFTAYVHSKEWTAHFEGRHTLIPVGFPGKPPRERAAA